MNDKSIKFIFFIIALLILGFFFSSELMPLKNVFFQITNPLGKTVISTTNKVKFFFSDIRSIRSLVKENNQLKQENQELQSKLSQLQEVRQENEVLKKELGFIQGQKDDELIPAEIFALSPASYFHTLKIDKGFKDGIKEGQAVISSGFLIGTVKEVGADSSEVFLLNNTNSLIAVVMQESRGTGLLKGGLKGLTVEDLPLDTQIKEGEMVVTSGLSDEIPQGLPIGTVEKIVSSQSEIFQRATVSSPVEFSKLEIVFVVK